MAKYVIDLLTNDKKYEVFSNNSRERAINKFDKSKVIPMYEEYYNHILND